MVVHQNEKLKRVVLWESRDFTTDDTKYSITSYPWSLSRVHTKSDWAAQLHTKSQAPGTLRCPKFHDDFSFTIHLNDVTHLAVIQNSSQDPSSFIFTLRTVRTVLMFCITWWTPKSLYYLLSLLLCFYISMLHGQHAFHHGEDKVPFPEFMFSSDDEWYS